VEKGRGKEENRKKGKEVFLEEEENVQRGRNLIGGNREKGQRHREDDPLLPEKNSSKEELTPWGPEWGGKPNHDRFQSGAESESLGFQKKQEWALM